MSDAKSRHSERRQWARVPGGNELVQVRQEGRQTPAAVVAQSLAGIELSAIAPFDAFREVEVLRDESAWHGLVKWTRSDADGEFRAGIQWLDTLQRDSVGQASFLETHGLMIACRVVDHREEGQVTVELPDGSQWDLPDQSLLRRSVHERRALLETLGPEIETLAELYDLPPQKPSPEKIQLILDYEFSPHLSPQTQR